MSKLSTKKLKVTFIAINIILALIFLVDLLWAVVRGDNEHLSTAVIVIEVAALMINILGCVAAAREYVCPLVMSCVCLLLLGILQALGIFHKQANQKNAHEIVHNAWANNAMDAIQMEHNCCGMISAQDYIAFDKLISASCYENNQIVDPAALHTVGCIAKLQDFYDTEHRNFIIVSCLDTALMFVAFVLGIMLAMKIRNNRRRMQF